jgi:YcaO-like protein with predicted kinase domain
MKFSPSSRKELERQHTIDELKSGLNQQESVLYRHNGNRRVKSTAFLKAIEKILPKAGLTRVADISFLSAVNYPVFQSCRPNYLTHSSTGQNSGSQGKGEYRTQAIVSCLMETLEGYCCESRNPELIRASYNFLKDHKVVYDPREFITLKEVTPPTLDEPIMWTPSYCLILKEEILIPAEAVYFPFMTLDYQTRCLYPQGSNGLASGSSYLEATIHALYELIERDYSSRLSKGLINVEAIYEEELKNKGVVEFIKKKVNDIEPQFYALEIPGLKVKNMPLIFCNLISEDGTYTGWGLSATVDISIDRAFSEALQTMATNISGTREDLGSEDHDENEYSDFGKTPQPTKRTLRIKDYRKRVHDKKFESLNDELDFIIKWVSQLGFKNILVTNLTRVGLDVPVVKVVIPGMELPEHYKSALTIRSENVISKRFPNMNKA